MATAPPDLEAEDITAVVEEILGEAAAPKPVERGPVTPEGSPKLTEEELAAVRRIIDELQEPEKDARFQILKYCQRNELYWKGIQDIFYDEVSEDWRRISEIEEKLKQIGDEDFVSTINIIRGHGESVAAALSTGLPAVRYFPQDADNPDDISTSKAWSKIAEMIQEQNVAPLLLLKIALILWKHGPAFSYNVHHVDAKYGIRQVPVMANQMQITEQKTCPECGAAIDELDVPEEEFQEESEPTPQPLDALDAFGAPGVDDSAGEPLPGLITCPNCEMQVEPIVEQYDEEVPYIERMDDVPRSREVIQIYGPQQVFVPHNSSTLDECAFLELDTEHHYALLRKIYPTAPKKITNGGETSEFERRTRAAYDLGQEHSTDVITARRIWLRNWAFEILEDEKIVQSLNDKFPNGCYVVIVNDDIVEYLPDSMDEHWTVAVHPGAERIYFEPLMNALIPVQDMRNEVVGLTIETIRQGVSETFADPKVLNFDEYSKSRAEVGAVRRAIPRPGQNLSQAFHQVKHATLSQEVGAVQARLDQDGQFVIGDYPSIYGGPNSTGSKTLGEYQMSQNQALQRLMIVYKVMSQLWAGTMKRSVASYIDYMQDDDYFPKKKGSGFVNVWIRQSELSGNIGDVRCENSEHFPMSWTQKRELLFQLLGLKNPAIDSSIFHPENIEEVQETIGWTNLYVPGLDQRNAQLVENRDMLQGMPVEINPWDDHAIHAQTTEAFLLSDEGQELKQTQPEIFEIFLMHYVSHQQKAAEEAAMAAMQEQEGEEGGGPPPKGGPPKGPGPSTDNAPPSAPGEE